MVLWSMVNHLATRDSLTECQQDRKKDSLKMKSHRVQSVSYTHLLAIGYVCGLFQTSYIIGRLYKTDIREHGSGNAGTTNALRTFGKKAGAMTLLGDCLKCVAAIFLVKLFLGKTYGDILPLLTVYAAAGCILGHNFPFRCV